MERVYLQIRKSSGICVQRNTAAWRSSKEIQVASPEMALRKPAPASGGKEASKIIHNRCEHGGRPKSDVDRNDNSSTSDGTHEDRVISSDDRDNIVRPPTLQLPGTTSEDGAPSRAQPAPPVWDEPLRLISSPPLARPALAVSEAGSGSATPVAKNGERYLSLSSTTAAAVMAHDSRNMSIGWNGGRHRSNRGAAAVSTGSSSGVPACSPSTSGPPPLFYSLPPLIQSQPADNARGSVGSLMFPLPPAAGLARTVCTPAAAASITALNHMFNIGRGHNSNRGKAPRSRSLLVPEQVARAPARDTHREPARAAEKEKEYPVSHHGLQRQKYRDSGSGGGLPMFEEEEATTLQETAEEDVYPLYQKPTAGPTEVEAAVAADPTAGRDPKRGGGRHPRPDGIPVHGRSASDSYDNLRCNSTASPTQEDSTNDQAGAKAANVSGTIQPLLCFQPKTKRVRFKDPVTSVTSGREARDAKKSKKQKREKEKDDMDNGIVPAVASSVASASRPPHEDGWAPGEWAGAVRASTNIW